MNLEYGVRYTDDHSCTYVCVVPLDRPGYDLTDDERDFVVGLIGDTEIDVGLWKPEHYQPIQNRLSVQGMVPGVKGGKADKRLDALADEGSLEWEDDEDDEWEDDDEDEDDDWEDDEDDDEDEDDDWEDD